MELKWLCRLLHGMGVLIPPRISLYCENKNDVYIAIDHVSYNQIKHIEVDCHATR